MKISQLLEPAKTEVQKPFSYKIQRANHLIKMFINNNSAVSCSFGKDSMVVLYLAIKQRPEIKVIFNNTGVEHPDTYKFKEMMKKKWNLNLIETKPEKSFWQVLRSSKLDDGRKHRNNCCYHLKHKPTKKAIEREGITHVFTGITVMESRHRMHTVCKFGEYYYTKKYSWMQIHPIAFWLESEVWSFIKENDIPYHPAYDQGYKRLGCITCTAYRTWKKEMQKHYPKLYKKIMLEGFGQTLLT